ncbi:unnamed protein product [Oppiella nova]|uniref:Aquaporin n=1 Tax=Oppiella nova TaxID=334625 RepID=A0A7R9LFR7_9ACAR|nr:unnamed protein product [Oppiella nova]CAG2163219.1 unnamed protein product [Oppiella nova]
MNKYLAEFIGTFWLVFGGCGSAIFAAAFPELGIGFAGVALAFGLTVLTGAFALGHISGGHFNPAVSVGLWVGGRFNAKDLAPYIIAQVIGGILAAFVLRDSQELVDSPAMALINVHLLALPRLPSLIQHEVLLWLYLLKQQH